VYQQLIPELQPLVAGMVPRPKRLVLTGHSLGGGVALLLGYQLTTALGIPTDVVTFGSLHPGDETFVAALAARVNMRQVRLLVLRVAKGACHRMTWCCIQKLCANSLQRGLAGAC
jgi:surfactin synthase thioesterase subunit